MKKILLFILCAAWLTALYAQSPTVPDRDALNLSSVFGYPLTIGDATTDNMQISVNKLLPMSVELDSMPRHQIGAIPNQTVWHEGEITIGFYVLTDTLKSSNVVLSYSIDFPPEGKITFNEQTGRFKYFPDKFDTRPFTITFTAQSGSKMITQDVVFTLMPASPPEYAAFGVEPKTMPSSNDDYTIIAQSIRRNVPFNNAIRDTLRSFSITGKELVFDGQIQNKLKYLNKSADIEELNLFAEKIIIREALHFPHTNITIYAKELIFEDLPGQAAASINTSPLMWDIPKDKNGSRGENAGNITLYIKDYKQSNPQKRFILVGGKGQNVFWSTQGAEWMPGTNRTPGNGGNGGILTSTIDVSDFCDVIHGSAGIQLNDKDQIEGAGQHGNDGSFVLNNDKEFTWLHPNFISAVVKHAKDAYLNVYNGFTHNILSEYTQRIKDLKTSEEWEDLDDESKMELNNAENEMQAIIYRIGQNLDYFGNPVGWVPMLSFEVNKMAFEQEIEKAIRVMYLSYWLKKIDAKNTDYIAACNQAIELAKIELADNKELITELIRLIPELQDEAQELERQIDELVIKIERKTQELLAKAKDNIKKQNQWGVVCGVLSGIAKVAPLVCSVIPGVGTIAGGLIGAGISAAISTGTNALAKATNANTTYMAYGEAIGSFAATTGEFFLSHGFEKISKTLNEIDISSLDSEDGRKTAYDKVCKTVDPLIKGVDKLHKALTENTVPNDQVAAELERLKAESREYLALIEESKVLNARKAQMIGKMANTISYATATSVEIQKNIAEIDGCGRNVFNGNSRRDLRALQYLDDMDRRARERLLKYHYNMGKAYEYRLLQPYTAELNLSRMMDRFITIAEANPGQPVLNATNFQDLKAIYEEQLSTVTFNILEWYNYNAPEQTIPIRFSLDKDDLDALNAGRSFTLNMYERGMVPPTRESARIVSFKIHDIKVHLEGNQNPSFANFELLMEHSGRSMMRSNGEIYWFDHYNNRNQVPITWGMDYDAKYGIIDQHQPSSASESLLYSLLTELEKKNNKGETKSIMIYSRPGAWADIYISKTDVVSSNTKMVIDELTFELQYDYMQRPPNNRNLDVYAADIDNGNYSLSPYIEVSNTDKSLHGRSNGRGTMYRTYDRNTSVNLTAPAEYGRYKFVNWTDQYGAVKSTKATVAANMSSDVVLKANYKYMAPMLSMKDSVLVGKNTQVIAVKVENKGSEEMEWSVVSNDSWIKIISKTKGVDTDYITLEIEENPSATAFRRGYITVTAPETAEYSKEFKVVQSNKEVNSIESVTIQSPKIIRNQGTDIYSVALGEAARNISIDVYSVGGQLVLKRYYYATSAFDFDLSHCSQGVFVVKIVYDGKHYVQKLIK